jgi:hypothetical protein
MWLQQVAYRFTMSVGVAERWLKAFWRWKSRKLNPQDLETIASLTLDHYNQNAEEFWQGARDHDVKLNTPFQSSSGECRINRLGGSRRNEKRPG